MGRGAVAYRGVGRMLLDQALRCALRSGRRIPCCSRDDGRLWLSDDESDRALAATRCRPCPVLDLCATVADEGGERWHVWAGRDRTRS